MDPLAGGPLATHGPAEAKELRIIERQAGHLSRQEGVDRGKAARASVPRSLHASWEPPADRTSPVEIIAEQAKSREPDLVPIRHGRMLVSPFTFYRGAAAVMAADLANTPVTRIRVQLCGDAHLLNFGGYASPERTMVFDVNDFDETLPGPWEWDLKRLAASLTVAGRAAGLKASERRLAVEMSVGQYRQGMRTLAASTELDVWYARLDEAFIVERIRSEFGDKVAPDLEKTLTKARSKDHLKAFAKLTEIVDGETRIVADPPLLVPARDLAEQYGRHDFREQLEKLFEAYKDTLPRDKRHLVDQYRMVDAARKVVGVGSVGTRCWVVLLEGRNDADPVFLQIKEAQESVLAPYAGKSTLAREGERVVEGQRMMQAASDIFLGWFRGEGLDGQERDFYVRQLWDWKVSADPTNISALALGAYGRMCAFTLARAHARSGDRIAISAYLGGGTTFDQAMSTFAEAYADQNERDYEEFAEAVRSGVLPVAEGI